MQKEIEDFSDKSMQKDGEAFMFLFLIFSMFTPKEKFDEIIKDLKSKEDIYDERD